MRVAIYARVSTEEQAGEGHSLDAQLRLCRDYCRTHGHTVAAEYVDPGESGGSMNRPAMRRLLADAAATPRRFDKVVFHKVDRWARDIVDTLSSLRRLREQHNVSAASVTEPIDSEGIAGETALVMMAWFAQVYRMNLIAETTKGKRARALKGLPNGSVPWGYTRVARVPGQQTPPPVIDPKQIEGYRRAIRLCAQGQRPSEIADVLNAAGYHTHSNWGERPFGTDTLGPILRSRFYLGEIQYKGEWLPGRHEPAIDAELWRH